MRRRLVRLGLVVAAVAVVGALLVTTVAGVPVGRPTVRWVDLGEQSLASPTDACLGGPTEPELAERWLREWHLDGRASGMTGSYRMVPMGGRGLVVWSTQDWHDAEVPAAMHGYPLGREVLLFVSGDGGSPFGFSFSMTSAAAAELCELQVTAPLSEGNVSVRFALTEPVRWTSLEEGETHTARTISGGTFEITRTEAARWEIEVGGDDAAPDYFQGGTLTITTDSAEPPWDEIHLEVDMQALVWGFDAELFLSPPVRCADTSGLYTLECP